MRSSRRSSVVLLWLLATLLLWAAGPGFRSRAQFDEHYRKHGAEFGRISQEEYLRLAQALRRDGEFSPKRQRGDCAHCPRADAWGYSVSR